MGKINNNMFYQGMRVQRENRRFCSCKGLSALLSSVLLVAIVALLSIVILNWVTTYTKTQQSTIETRALNCTGADVSIHTIFIDLSSNISRISVRNSGFTADKIVDAAIINKQGDEAANLTAFPIDFPDGSISTISFNITGKITACANFSKAIVSTQCTSDDQDKPVACS